MVTCPVTGTHPRAYPTNVDMSYSPRKRDALGIDVSDPSEPRRSRSTTKNLTSITLNVGVFKNYIARLGKCKVILVALFSLPTA